MSPSPSPPSRAAAKQIVLATKELEWSRLKIQLKEAWSKRASRCTGTGSEAHGAGRTSQNNEVHIHQKALVVNSRLRAEARQGGQSNAHYESLAIPSLSISS